MNSILEKAGLAAPRLGGGGKASGEPPAGVPAHSSGSPRSGALWDGGDRASRGRAGLLWAGLAIALSPILVDLARHWLAEPWALPSAIFLPLLVWGALTDATVSPRRRDGYALLALALALEVVTVGGGVARHGRPAIPIAILGLARLLGSPTPARALVALWLVPVPHGLQQAVRPALESIVGFAVPLLPLPLRWSPESHSVVGAAGSLAISGPDAGLALAGLLAGLGWHAAASGGASVRAAAGAALRWALWAPVVQLGALGLALAVLALGAPDHARGLLTGLPPLIALAAAALARLGRARTGAASALDPRSARSVEALPRERRDATALALVVALVLVGTGAWLLELPPPLRVDASPLAELPRSLGAWEGVDLPLEDDVESMLRADFNLQRAYVHGLGDLVLLYVGYYGTERGGRPEHTPDACYRAHGWDVRHRRVLEIDPHLGLRANEFVVEKKGRRDLVQFWFRSYRSTGLLGGIDQTFDRLRARLAGERADGSLVRISTTLEAGEEESVARARLAQFAVALEPALAAHWPTESEPRSAAASQAARRP